MTTEHAIREYLEHVRLGRSPETERTYRSHLKRFAAWLGDQPISGDVLPRYWRIASLERGHQYASGAMGGVRSFLRWLVAQGHSSINYEAATAALSDAMGRATYRTPRIDKRLGDIVRLVDNSPARDIASLRDKAVIRVLFCTGMRRAEVVSLDRRDVGDGEAIITGKGSKERVVFFEAPTIYALQRYLEARSDTDPALFLTHRGGGSGSRIGPQTVGLIVNKYSRLAGVPATPHAFRHHKASSMLNRGASLSVVQDILGHASPETTKRIYAHYDRAVLRAAFDQFSEEV